MGFMIHVCTQNESLSDKLVTVRCRNGDGTLFELHSLTNQCRSSDIQTVQIGFGEPLASVKQCMNAIRLTSFNLYQSMSTNAKISPYACER